MNKKEMTIKAGKIAFYSAELAAPFVGFWGVLPKDYFAKLKQGRNLNINEEEIYNLDAPDSFKLKLGISSFTFLAAAYFGQAINGLWKEAIKPLIDKARSARTA